MNTLTKHNIHPLTSAVSDKGSNAVKTDEAEEITHRFQEGMGSHPLWQEYLAELKAQREADITESNRLADLEMGL